MSPKECVKVLIGLWGLSIVDDVVYGLWRYTFIASVALKYVCNNIVQSLRETYRL